MMNARVGRRRTRTLPYDRQAQAGLEVPRRPPRSPPSRTWRPGTGPRTSRTTRPTPAGSRTSRAPPTCTPRRATRRRRDVRSEGGRRRPASRSTSVGPIPYFVYKLGYEVFSPLPGSFYGTRRAPARSRSATVPTSSRAGTTRSSSRSREVRRLHRARTRPRTVASSSRTTPPPRPRTRTWRPDHLDCTAQIPLTALKVYKGTSATARSTRRTPRSSRSFRPSTRRSSRASTPRSSRACRWRSTARRSPRRSCNGYP